MDGEPHKPAIGKDEWVATQAERAAAGGRRAALERRWRRVPALVRLALVVVPAAAFPLFVDSDYVMQVAVVTAIYALLALGLNVVVGFAGLLDLGYVAFYGFGAYAFALLSSDQFGIHWPALATVPLIVAATALLGFVLALPSRRLLGDYLAIVTLFFGTIFVVLVTNANRITPPWRSSAVDITGGPNGIAGIDQFDLVLFKIESVTQYFYLALVVFTVVLAGLFLLDDSRVGRAWRALREDPLAAELMGMPVNRLKLLAFSFGAGIAGLTGTIFAPLQNGVFPSNFDLALLITLYAMVILGGAGSIAGVIMGAVAINVVLEVLRTPDKARVVFYGLVLIALISWLRPWWLLASVLLGTLAFGFGVHAVATAAWPEQTAGAPGKSSWIGDAVDGWTVLLTHPKSLGNAAYGLLLLAICLLTLVRGRRRTIALVPVLYLASFVWENRLVAEPSITRLILLGSLLIALMNVRPQGLLGSARVEIV